VRLAPLDALILVEVRCASERRGLFHWADGGNCWRPSRSGPIIRMPCTAHHRGKWDDESRLRMLATYRAGQGGFFLSSHEKEKGRDLVLGSRPWENLAWVRCANTEVYGFGANQQNYASSNRLKTGARNSRLGVRSR
jgi:hypothetical protein